MWDRRDSAPCAGVNSMVKLLRAHGGCLGRDRRRRTWQAAISFGEPHTGVIIRRSPNGETLPSKPRERPAEFIGGCERTQGSEPSQYLEEKKETSIPKVVASEIGTAQTRSISVFRGL